MNHTPGPWTTKEGKVTSNYGSVASLNIAHAKGFAPTEEEKRANARLIAAAPEMLEALKLIADTPCNHGAQDICPREIAQAAIAKAEGRE
ncbi:MAG: hypothetical protein M0R49_08580 [Limnochordia bacterium]|nr:hypothetical protein [Limnochordia bacterium]